MIGERPAGIAGVAGDRRADVREVRADLVHPAGVRGAADQRVGVRRALDGERRVRRQPVGVIRDDVVAALGEVARRTRATPGGHR